MMQQKKEVQVLSNYMYYTNFNNPGKLDFKKLGEKEKIKYL